MARTPAKKAAKPRKTAARGTYTDEQREQARRVFETEGLSAAAKASGVARSTISGWAKRGQWTPADTADAQKKRAQTEAGRQTIAQRKLELADRIVEEAAAVLEQLRKPTTEKKIVTLQGKIVLEVDEEGLPDFASGWTVATVERDAPTFAEQTRIATTFGILVDKLQVLTGGVTHRVGVQDDREVQSAAEQVLRLLPGGREAG